MRNHSKYIILYLCLIAILLGTVIQLAQAQQPARDNLASTQQSLNQAQLDQMLAPIALYPDTLLSHILVASTYPLEVVQAARWREKNQDLDEEQALQAAEQQDWDPSVKALTPFTDLLAKLSDDLAWLQSLGDAFLANEVQVLDTVQNLRHKAYASGNLQTNDYLAVGREQDKIVIQNVVKEVVYVPYYDTRVVYGDWWWPSYQPIYWRSPRHYAYRSGFYWSPSFHISTGFYFGGFHWSNNYVVIDHHHRHRSNHFRQPRVRVREYPRWQHNPHHRRGVRYTQNNHPRQHVRTSEGLANKDRRYTTFDKRRALTSTDVQSSSHQQQVKQRLQQHNRRQYAGNPDVVEHRGHDKALRPARDTKRIAENQVQRAEGQRHKNRELSSPPSPQKHVRTRPEHPLADRSINRRVTPKERQTHQQEHRRAARSQRLEPVRSRAQNRREAIK